MDYRIRRTPDELESTGLMEICPSKFSGKHWQPGSLFVWEDAFNVAEGIVLRHLPSFDHMSSNDIPASIGAAIIADWLAAADRLPKQTSSEASAELHLAEWFREPFHEDFVERRSEIVTMLRALAYDCRQFYSRSEWLCIIGV